MKIALIGYGKMGRLIDEMASEIGHDVIAKFSNQLGKLKEKKEALELADVAIDFSHSSCVLENLNICLSMGKPIVIGTTGWESQVETAREMVSSFQGSCLFSPNFSLGFYLFEQIVAYAAALFQSFPQYDVAGIECHHKKKKDQPSGSAKSLQKTLLEQMPRINELEFTSVRCGHNPGFHSIHFDSLEDVLILSHEARNRKGFAYGAICGSEWIIQRKGFFTIKEMMENFLCV